MYLTTLTRLCARCTLRIAAVLAFSALGMAQAYQQTNLVSDSGRRSKPTQRPARFPACESLGPYRESYKSVVDFR